MNCKLRITHIDYLRVGSIFYIVGYLHLLNYTAIFPDYFNYLTYLLTLVSLGMLVFISGYLIGIKEWNINTKSTIQFFGKKLLRIYPPFLVAAILFIFLKIIDTNSAINVIRLTSQFLPPNPITLWFVPMIVMFYSISPLLYSSVKKYWYFLLLSLSLFAGLVFYSHATNLLDRRLILYFPLFAIGLFLGKNDPEGKGIPIWLIILALPIGWFISSLSGSEFDLSNYFMTPFVTLVTLLFFTFTIRVTKNVDFNIGKIVKHLSYSSYFMYLFHRPIFSSMLLIWTPDSEEVKFLYLVFVCFPLIVILAWFGQKSYDDFCCKIILSKRFFLEVSNRLYSRLILRKITK